MPLQNAPKRNQRNPSTHSLPIRFWRCHHTPSFWWTETYTLESQKTATKQTRASSVQTATTTRQTKIVNDSSNFAKPPNYDRPTHTSSSGLDRSATRERFISLYYKSSSQVNVGGQLSEQYVITTGVLQGDVRPFPVRHRHRLHQQDGRIWYYGFVTHKKKSFKKFIKNLSPDYSLPCRIYLTYILIPVKGTVLNSLYIA